MSWEQKENQERILGLEIAAITDKRVVRAERKQRLAHAVGSYPRETGNQGRKRL